jgi:hypothetical protein
LSTHNDPGYDEMAEWVRTTEVDLGRSQNAYEHEGAMPIQEQVHPDANPDGFTPPEEVDWSDVFSDINSAETYEPTEDEKRGVVEDLDLSSPDDPDYEGAAPKDELEDEGEPSFDLRFEYNGLVDRWPHLADVYAAIVMSADINEAEPIGEDVIHLETLRCPEGSNRWYVDDLMQENLFVQHDPSMNHPLSADVAVGNHVVWVYDRNKPECFPNEPTGYIHNGSVFRRPKVWQKA